MEQPKQFYTEKPVFKGAQNIVMRCSVDGCGWNALGPRAEAQKAWNEHYRLNHSQEVGVMMFDKNMRSELWLPGWRKS